MHSKTLLHHDVSKKCHAQLLHHLLHVNEWTYHALTNTLNVAFLFRGLPLRDFQYVVLAIYTCMIVVTFLSLCSFNVRRIFLGFTIFFIISVSIVFSLRVSQPTYGWLTNVSATS